MQPIHPVRTPSSPSTVLKVPPSSGTPLERRTLLGFRLWASLSHHDKGSSNNLIKSVGENKGTRVLEKKKEKQGGGGRKKGAFSLTPVLAMIFELVVCLAGKLKYGYLSRFWWALAYSSMMQCFSALAQQVLECYFLLHSLGLHPLTSFPKTAS